MPCPWSELERRTHITSAIEPLPPSAGGGFLARYADGEVVLVLDSTRSHAERTEILAWLLHQEASEQTT